MTKYFSKCLIAVVMTLPLLASHAAKAAPMFDIMVIMDNSSSLDAMDFATQKDIVQNMFDSFAIGPADTRFGIVSYATGGQLTMGLTDNAAQLNNALANANQLYGQTNHALALQIAKDQLGAPNPPGRPDNGVTDIVVLLTDGISNQGPSPVLSAIQVAEQLKAAGAYVFTFGFGGAINESDLRSYSSSPADDFAFTASDFDSGFAAMNDIIYQINQLGTVASVDAPAPLSLLLLGLAGIFLCRARTRTANSHQRQYASI